MRTTVDIPDEMLVELMRHTKAKTKREAVAIAVTEFVRRGRMAEPTRYLGTCRELVSQDEPMELGEAKGP